MMWRLLFADRNEEYEQGNTEMKGKREEKRVIEER